jgi:EAL domain-containing protein (putative c-di-GMP-specific phosphodiesterase class I)
MALNYVDEIASSSHSDPVELLRLIRSVVRELREFLHMDIAYVSQFHDEFQTFLAVDFSTEGEQVGIREGDSTYLSKSFCKRVADGKLSNLIIDATTEPAVADIPETFAVPIKSFISAPIRMGDGKIFGSICCFSRSTCDWLTPQDASLLGLFSEFIARSFSVKADTLNELFIRQQEISDIIKSKRYQILYQPIIEYPTKNIIGFEALTRFQRNNISGDTEEVFKIASAAGMAPQLELEIIQSAYEQFEPASDDQFLSVNLSPKTVESDAFFTAFPTWHEHALVLELTEHDAVENYASFNKKIDNLTGSGAKLAIDDAGSGYASFKHVVELNPEIIKIDASTIRGVNKNKNKQGLIKAFVAYGDFTGTKIIAEGVESEEELDMLLALGVKLFQGYFFSQPAESTSLLFN